MKYVCGKLAQLFLLLTAIFVLSSCNGIGGTQSSNGTIGTNNAYFQGARIDSDVQSEAMNIQWSLDGFTITNGVQVRDMAWHLVTLTATNITEPLKTPIAIKGVQYALYPKPTDGRGESVEISDINCNVAQFSESGDTCSSYIRVYYNTATGISNPPLMQVQFATNAYPTLSAFINVYYSPLLELAQGDYRVVSPIETKYYSGSAVASNSGQYQILNMKNISLPALTINTISNITNPAFVLMNRTSAESNDPYYGANSQCSLVTNEKLKQINYLPELNAECILVYKAAATSSKAVQEDAVTVGTTAANTAPWTDNTLDLIANYVTGAPIPNQTTNGANFKVVSGSAYNSGTAKVMSSTGTLSSGTISTFNDPFNVVNMTYNFKPKPFAAAPYGIRLYPSYATFAIADQIEPTTYNSNEDLGGSQVIWYPPKTTLHAGDKILTDASSTNPVTIGQVDQLVPSVSSVSGSGSVSSCGGAWASSSANIKPDVISTYMSNVHLHMENNSSGHCGGSAPATFDKYIPFSSPYSTVVYDVDDHGCSGNKWDMGGKISISTNGCSGDNCSYTVTVTAHHGGEGGNCQNTMTYPLNFKKPYVYMQLSKLSNFNQATSNPAFAGLPGQSLNAMLGTQGGFVAQSVQCGSALLPKNTAGCIADGSYSNGLSATNMSYNIGLNAGDTLYQGTANFTASEGYDLTSFNISH